MPLVVTYRFLPPHDAADLPRRPGDNRMSWRSKAGRRDDPPPVGSQIPIGGGTTEAACKVLVEQRLCGPGMEWEEPGAAAVRSVRCLTSTAGRRSQCRGEIDRYGFPTAA